MMEAAKKENLISRRSRIKYTKEQADRLENIFEGHHYPDTTMQEELAMDMGVTTERINIWFQNRRSRFKRQRRTEHVAWMRKQIFLPTEGQGHNLLYGTPQLPALTSACHVLSPLDPQTARGDASMEMQTFFLSPVFGHVSPLLDYHASSADRGGSQNTRPTQNHAQSIPLISHMYPSRHYATNLPDNLNQFTTPKRPTSTAMMGRAAKGPVPVDLTLPDRVKTERIPMSPISQNLNTMSYSDTQLPANSSQFRAGWSPIMPSTAMSSTLHHGSQLWPVSQTQFANRSPGSDTSDKLLNEKAFDCLEQWC